MWMIGCNFHPRYQQSAALNQAKGELLERRLSHEGKEAQAFDDSLPRGATGITLQSARARAWLD